MSRSVSWEGVYSRVVGSAYWHLSLPQLCKALVDSRASDVTPTCFCSVYSVWEGTGRGGGCRRFGVLVVPELYTPRQVGSSVFLVIAGLHLRSQVLRKTREMISAPLCCSSGINIKRWHGFLLLSTSTLVPTNIPLTTFLPTRLHGMCFKFQFWSVTGSNRVPWSI